MSKETITGIISELKYLLYAMFIYLDIDIDAFKILFWFMLIDTIAGTLKALKMNYKEFSFKKLLWGLISKMGILIIPLIVALLFKAIGKDMLFGVELVVKILTVSEFISVISNIYTVKTGIAVKDIDIFTMLFKFLRQSSIGLLTKYTTIKIKEDEPKV